MGLAWSEGVFKTCNRHFAVWADWSHILSTDCVKEKGASAKRTRVLPIQFECIWDYSNQSCDRNNLSVGVARLDRGQTSKFSDRAPSRKPIERALQKKGSQKFWIWRPRRDSNPCYRRERAVSWAGLDDGDALEGYPYEACSLSTLSTSLKGVKVQLLCRRRKARHTQ